MSGKDLAQVVLAHVDGAGVIYLAWVRHKHKRRIAGVRLEPGGHAMVLMHVVPPIEFREVQSCAAVLVGHGASARAGSPDERRNNDSSTIMAIEG